MRINLSIRKEHQDVYDYLQDQANASLFICQLVRAHMDANKTQDEKENMILETLLEIKSMLGKTAAVSEKLPEFVTYGALKSLDEKKKPLHIKRK